MAFDIRNLSPVGGQSNRCKTLTAGALGKGATAIWTYVTEDVHATVDSAGYYNGGVAYGGAYNLLEIGDIIWVTVYAAGVFSTYGHHSVKNKASGTIDVTDVTVGVATDTD